LGIPIATTRAYATQEYVLGRRSVLECEPAEPREFATLVERMIDEKEELRAAAVSAVKQEREFHHRSLWANYIDEFVRSNYDLTIPHRP
jgi:hypothetical protein